MLSKEVSSKIFLGGGCMTWDWTQISRDIGKHSIHLEQRWNKANKISENVFKHNKILVFTEIKIEPSKQNTNFIK